MSDEDLIRQAYEEFIKNLFKNFYDAYTTSNSSTQEKAAEQVFQNAVKSARAARDRALAILPKWKSCSFTGLAMPNLDRNYY